MLLWEYCSAQVGWAQRVWTLNIQDIPEATNEVHTLKLVDVSGIEWAARVK